MTDMQFKSYRRQQLKEFERMLELARSASVPVLVKMLEQAIEEARADIEA